MKKIQRSILQSLNILPGEEQIVGALIVLSGLVSLARLFNTTASSTLFLHTFNASILPFTYISMAVVAPLIGFLNTRLEKRVPFARLHLYNIIGYFIILGALRLAMSLTTAGWPVFIYFMWSEIGWILLNLMLWGLAGQLLNVRQAKRLFGLIAASGSFATISIGLFLSGIVSKIGVSNLPLLVLIALAGVIGLLVFISRVHAGQLADSAAEEDSPTSASSNWQIPRKYINMLILLAMVTEASFYFVDIIFYKQVQIEFASHDKFKNYPIGELRVEEDIVSVPKTSDIEVASFLGRYLAIMNLLVLLSNFFLVAPLINKLGMRLSLLIMPVLTGLVALVFAAGGLMIAPAVFLFRVAVFNSVLDWVIRDTISRSAVLILYQPLPPSIRSRTQTQVETIAMPYAQGIAGLVLAGLGVLGFASLQINWILLVILFGAIVIAFSLGKAYGPVLLEVLSRRTLKLTEQSLILNDLATRTLLLRELHSPYPEAVIYALDTLEAMDYQLETELPALLEHSSPNVRRDVLVRIEHRKSANVIPFVRKLLEREEHPNVRAAGFLALASISSEHISEMELNLDSTDPILFINAMVSLLRQNSERLDLEKRLTKLFSAKDSADRQMGLQIVTELGKRDRYTALVLNTLHDIDHDVRRAAIWAAVQLDQSDLWDSVFESLNDAHIRHTTMGALIARKENTLPLIRQYLLKPPLSHGARVSCLRMLAHLRNPEAIPDLLFYLESNNVELRHEALLALHRCRYRFDIRNMTRFRKALHAEIADATQTCSLQLEVEAMGSPMLLHDGLEIAWTHHRERLFWLLWMLYDPSVIQRVRDNLELDSREKRAYALEVLDNTLADEFKPLVLPLLEDIDIAQRLELWNRSARVPGVSNLLNTELILELPSSYDTESRTPWVKSCVIQALVRNPSYQLKIESLTDESELVQNTLTWARTALSAKKENNKMLSIIERVLILKTVGIFGDTPDHLLAEVADLLEEQHLNTNETFITKGDPATCMYIIVNGEVSIHDGDREINQLGARDIVGEMAVLDVAPRSASVTTMESTHLLKLDRTPFFELIADRAEVAQGIIRVLARRLRNAQNATRR
jgi:HEAT repeat protein